MHPDELELESGSRGDVLLVAEPSTQTSMVSPGLAPLKVSSMSAEDAAPPAVPATVYGVAESAADFTEAICTRERGHVAQSERSAAFAKWIDT